MMEA
jgi:hypothetical protein